MANPNRHSHRISEEKLFFIYCEHKIYGPLNHSEIIKKFIRNEITTKIWIKNVKDADEKGNWCPVDLSADQEDKDNEKLQARFPKLYDYMIPQIRSRVLKQYTKPVDIPEEAAKDETFGSGLARIIGKFFLVIGCIILMAHTIWTVCIAVVCVDMPTLCFYEFFATEADKENKRRNVIVFWTIFLASLGLLITPFIVVFVIFLDCFDLNLINNGWKEVQIQSWMIAYLVWGLCSCLFINGTVAGILFDKKSVLNHLYYYLFWILGVDFDFKDKSDIEKFLDDVSAEMCVGFVFPALAAVAPSAIIGFICNFAFEEKFELKCHSDIINDYLCFGNYGCCDVISSHDIENTYSFIGELTSNILATWAVIRIVGYLMVNVSPEISMFAKRNVYV